MQPRQEPLARRSCEMACKYAKTNGGSVCESNAPLTSEMPIAGFEDRESHRTPFASASMDIEQNYLRCCGCVRLTTERTEGPEKSQEENRVPCLRCLRGEPVVPYAATLSAGARSADTAAAP